MNKYKVIIRETKWEEFEIKSETPLSIEEIEEIQSQGKDGIPDRFDIEIVDDGGEFPENVSIEEIK